MKRITNSFIKNIVRQSLNESYGLLNEDDKNNKQNVQCLDGIFCLGDGSLSKAQELSRTLTQVGGGRQGIVTRSWKVIDALKSNCGILKYGVANESIASQAVEDIGMQYSYTNVGEDVVKKTILKLNYPEWCMVIELAQQKGYADGDDFWNKTTVGTDDYPIYVVNPSLQVLRNTIKKTETREIKYNEEIAAKQKEIDDNFKKSGWATKEEWEKSGWKVKPIEYTIGGGGNSAGQVSFKGYECITEHPALINTPVKIPQGVGYKLDTGNQTIDSFIFGVQKQGTGDTATDVGVKMKTDSQIPVQFYCDTDKYIKYSLSTNVWNYDAALSNVNEVFTNSAPGAPYINKVVLTTHPDLEDDGISNNSIQLENIKGYRYNLLTEAEYKMGAKGPEVGIIQKKLGLPADKGTPTYGPKTKAAVEKFQTDNGIPVTGIVDDATYTKIMEIPDPIEPSATDYTRELTLKSTGPDVVAIQTKLGIGTKGGYGPETQKAVMAFQKKYTELDDTGIVDEKTFKKIMAIPAAGTTTKYSGKKHNYVVGNWIKVTPETADEQLSGNDGFFKIIAIIDDYSVVINTDFKENGPGGSTQRVLFGEDAKQGTQEVIRSNGGSENDGGTGRRETGGDEGTGRRSRVVGGGGNVDPEQERKRKLRNQETCNTLRQIKQYLNNTKGLSMTVNCKWNQEIRNQVMLALTGGTPAPTPTPIEEPKVTTPGGNVTVY